MPMPGKDNNLSEYIGPHKDKEYTLDAQNIEGDYRNLVGKSLNTKSRARDSLSEHTFQAKLFASELSSPLREVKFGE